ncbi:DUF7620 family protein [Kitasatospora fiedleri]|uniref:DUF7620 family protein n=1 Tax=Kitasatospora fiedleri TaxID=2991545 RepID=UPI00249BAFBC|nr:hypothetical protein [Kitasatospora fiedleri]
MLQGGAAGLLALVVLLILTGRLIPRRTYDDVREERDMWRAAFRESEAARAVEHEHAVTAVEVGQTAVQVLRALPTPEGWTMLRRIRAWCGRSRRVTPGQQAARSALYRAECDRLEAEGRAPVAAEVARELRALRVENHFAERIRLSLEGGR